MLPSNRVLPGIAHPANGSELPRQCLAMDLRILSRLKQCGRVEGHGEVIADRRLVAPVRHAYADVSYNGLVCSGAQRLVDL